MTRLTTRTHAAPGALVEHCSRRAVTRRQNAPPTGGRDVADIAALVSWLQERDAFADHDAWVSAGMALRLELGDAGRDVWALTHNDSVTDGVENAKWNSFSTEPTADSVTLASLIKKARDLGWRGNIQRSVDSMFSGVAALAAASGASLSSGSPQSLFGDTARIVSALGQPILDNFLAGTRDAPTRPRDGGPTLPADTMSDHPLYSQLCEAIDRILAMAEGTFRQDRVLPTLAVLHATHAPTCDSLVARIAALGGVLAPGKLDSAIKNFEWKVKTEFNTAAGFKTNNKGEPAAENSDNVHVFVRERSISLRYNTWKDQAEVKDGELCFVQLTDHMFGDLLMDAKNSHFNYHPAEGLFRRGLISNARRTLYDPVTERIDALAAAWDGKPRLSTWLTHTTGVPCDVYHQAVGRNLIGGMVRRARYPGCQQAETVIFISQQQGTGKSTLTKILALEPEWHTDSFKFDGSPQNTIPQLFGKWVVELSELAGMAQKDMEHVKSFLSATSDNFTKKYEAFATDHPRRCVFIGTSNDRRPLIDATGNRRFLPVQVAGEVNTDWLQANIGQLIGEAAVLDAAGQTFAIPRNVWEEAGRHQEQARSMSPVEELCYEWFDRPGNFYITATDIGRALKMTGQSQHSRYAGHLDKMGWRTENLMVPTSGRKCRVWVRGDSNKLGEVTRLEPVQAAVGGPVEMRMSMRK